MDLESDLKQINQQITECEAKNDVLQNIIELQIKSPQNIADSLATSQMKIDVLKNNIQVSYYIIYVLIE